MLTAERLAKAGCDRELAEQHLPHMVAAMLSHGISTDRRARAFLAQMLHECGHLRWMVEIWGPNQWQLTYGHRMGNRSAAEGKRYRGRSPIMLTGRDNYTTYSRKLGVDLVNNPELAASPSIGWRIAARYWRDKGLNELADRGDFRGITRAINGAATDHAPSHHLMRVAIYRRLGPGLTPDPLTRRERRLVNELKRLRAADANPQRRAAIVAWLTAQRKRIWREAQRTGWERANRRQRYRKLQAMTAEAERERVG